jgi:hypothetical protein
VTSPRIRPIPTMGRHPNQPPSWVNQPSPMRAVLDIVSSGQQQGPRVRGYADGVKVTWRQQNAGWRCEQHYDRRCGHVAAVEALLTPELVQRMRSLST